MSDPEFTFESVRKASVAAASLCQWVIAVEKYYQVSRQVWTRYTRKRPSKVQIEL